MRKFFYPESVAIVGVSGKPGNLGHEIIKNLHKYKYAGRIYGVGSKRDTVDGVEVYPSISALPEPVDLVGVIVPARFVPGVIRECGEKGIEAAAILTGGFAEFGAEGQARQDELAETAKRCRVRFIGPNGMGLGNPEVGLWFCFSHITEGAIQPGSVTWLSQSGSVAYLGMWTATDDGLGVSKYVSMGNKVNMDETDMLPYFLYEDDKTGAVCLYLEGVTQGRKLVEIAKQAPKPIIALKSNISEVTAHAARSHSASLASDDRVVTGAFRQAGITRVTTFKEAIMAAKALSMPPMRGNNVGIIGSTGGPGVIATDFCFRNGFNLPEFPASFADEMAKRRESDILGTANPLDLAAVFDNNTFLFCIEQIANFPNVDGLVVSLFHDTHLDLAGPSSDETVVRVSEIMKRANKPIALTFMDSPAVLHQMKQQKYMPIFSTVDECVIALSMLREHTVARELAVEKPEALAVDKDKAAKLISAAKAEGLTDIGPAAMEVLASYGIPTAPLSLAKSASEAAAIAENLGFPVVMKAVARDLSHKSDIGGVMLNLSTRQAVEEAFNTIKTNVAGRMAASDFVGVVVQPMVSGGHEFILGAKQDASFGPVVLFGLGGVFTEVFSDVACRLAPLTKAEAKAMIGELKASKLLKGVRGQGPSDVDALAEALVRLGQLISDQKEIKEIDINPIKVFPGRKGAIAVDARVVIDS